MRQDIKEHQRYLGPEPLGGVSRKSLPPPPPPPSTTRARISVPPSHRPMIPTPPLRGTGEAAEAPGVQDGRRGAQVLAVATERFLLPGDPLHRLRAVAGQPLSHVPPTPPLSPSPKSRPLLHAHCRVNKRCSHCLASYKYIEECRLPKYFTVRPQPPVCGDALLEAPPARPHPIRRSMWCTTAPSRRWIACRKSLGNASTRSIVCISKRSSIAIWCATLRREP